MSILLILAISLFAQVTQKQADFIVKEYLQSEMIEYDFLCVNINIPSESGIIITTSNEEVFTAKYACWTYYINETETIQRRYLFVKEDNGNLLEVIASNDIEQRDSTHWKIVDETVSLSEKKIENFKPLYPNPTRGQLIIDNEQLKINKLKIIDIYGKAVKQFSIPNSQFSIEDLPAGIYLLKIETETGTVTQIISKY